MADLDRDGDDDLALARGLLLFSQGDGTFLELHTDLFDGFYIAAADLDRDGDVDLLADRAGEKHLALNQGDGKFLRKELGLAHTGGYAPLIADFQGDGWLDIASQFLSYRPAISVLLNRGAGDFGPEMQIAMCSGLWSPVAGDLEGDGDLDLVGGVSRSLGILRNHGDGTFMTRATYAVGGAPQGVEVADLDGDGDLDLAGIRRHTGEQLLLFENDGRASYQQKLEVELERIPLTLRVAELNGDGKADLVLVDFTPGEEASGVSIFQNRGGWVFEPGERLQTGSDTRALVAEDVDGDRDRDLVTLNRDPGKLTVFLNDGSGAFPAPAVMEVDGYPMLLLAEQLDGDALPDLIIGAQGDLRVFKNRGAGAFQESGRLGVWEEPQAAVSGDLDRDGHNDLVFGFLPQGQCMAPRPECGGLLGVAFNDGHGAWERIVGYPAGVSSLSLDLSDLDRDGDLDLVAVMEFRDMNGMPSLVTFLNQGDGSLVESGRTTVHGNFSSGPRSADLDGDQTPDLVWANGGSISVLRGLWQPAAAPDLNRDGVPDECAVGFFRRGDVDGNGRLNLSDAVALLGHLFLGGRSPACPDGADIDDNGAVQVTDAIGALGFLFLGGSEPAAPGPRACGPDPTEDGLESCFTDDC